MVHDWKLNSKMVLCNCSAQDFKEWGSEMRRVLYWNASLLLPPHPMHIRLLLSWTVQPTSKVAALPCCTPGYNHTNIHTKHQNTILHQLYSSNLCLHLCYGSYLCIGWVQSCITSREQYNWFARAGHGPRLLNGTVNLLAGTPPYSKGPGPRDLLGYFLLKAFSMEPLTSYLEQPRSKDLLEYFSSILGGSVMTY